ncbi:MAG: transglycosylase SLT domain-containing protein [Thermoanaerobaculia bacterium]|nr:transglycosylase SLT domain-containing protein [Thermoanaerobaculia bacterium]
MIRAPVGALADPARREIARLAADCLLAAGRAEESAARWQAVLAADPGDRVANGIVDRWAELEELGRSVPALSDRVAGEALARQRDFARALPRLERALAAEGDTGGLAWTTARARFWQGEHAAAADALAAWRPPGLAPERAAEARHLEGRARDLAGDTEGARHAFRAAVAAAPASSWAAAAHLSLLRLAWEGGREEEALAELAALERRTVPAATRARALLFAAAADLAAGRRDRAGAWLERARATRALPAAELDYWSGRRHEGSGRAAAAVAAYASAIEHAPFHPLAVEAGERLRADARLAATARRAALDAAPRRAWAIWRGLGEETRAEAAARRLGPGSRAGAARPATPPSWPLWRSPRRDAATLLLGLGLWREGAGAAPAHFPARDPGLALAAVERLAAAGAHRQALALAESAASAAARELPEPLWSAALRRALAPDPYPDLVADAAARHGLEPALLLAIVREESRFDPEAFSPAGARGLAQFVLPTARRVAARLGRPALRAADLDRPEVALELAAAHLAELARRYPGRTAALVAAYNAGETQADRWLAGGSGAGPAELLARIGFRETRAYVARVLASRQRYLERPSEAPDPPGPAEPPPSAGVAKPPAP